MIWNIILLVISAALSFANRPKPPAPAKLSDFHLPQITEGTPQQVVFGDCWLADWMILGYGNYRTRPIKASGGK
ncbi:MAG: hypothetical protein JSS44_09130 [Proteobacteria bacterium]|nr:hypothetical protein [Pseudomonadota bacterium]MBS0463505.1 hypothetical protein [Pseudomonadota bacterium]